ncbi:hypothetical protein QEZ54_06480 [Catellatospora sp. KI3]|uniref:hypothetical protein n=1 Tax=Catellatospora sp. KI3 TaxID=3041620 RepID=UPI002483270C|nr:hypothetical protein [Catellatospora sp. KI3]MDI1460605.1 hypothetical protein [Catellatospora sp. KI3]
MNTHRSRKLDDYTKLLIALFVTPAPFEIAIGVVKREQYDFRRLAIILGTLIVLAGVLGVLRRRTWWYPQIIVGYYVLLVGVVLSALGVTAVIWDDEIRAMTGWSGTVEIIVTALSPSLGVLLVASGVYLVRERRRRAVAELDNPLPDRTSKTRIVAVNKRTSAVWTTDDTTHQRGRNTLVTISQGFLSVDDLHYIAWYTPQADCEFYVDLFDDDALELLATGDSAERRTNYMRHGRHIRHLITKLSDRLDDLETGLLVRVVLDVEKGAIYHYNLPGLGFLIGVTLDQRKVDPTDWKLSDLANAILRAHGKNEDDDFYRLCPHCGRTNRGHPVGPTGPVDTLNVVPMPRRDVG